LYVYCYLEGITSTFYKNSNLRSQYAVLFKYFPKYKNLPLTQINSNLKDRPSIVIKLLKTNFFIDNVSLFRTPLSKKGTRAERIKTSHFNFNDEFKRLIDLIANTNDIALKIEYQKTWEFLIKGGKSINEVLFKINNKTD